MLTNSFFTDFKMASLAYLTQARGQLRAKVTRLYNDRESFAEYSAVVKNSTKFKLEKLKDDLSEADEKIASLQFDDNFKVEELNSELEACEEYSDKICDCLSRLMTIETPQAPPSANITQAARSLLKSPIAPLPTFSSKLGENFNLFLEQFEETLSKFSYTEYDKLLLLKQQVTGRAAILLESLEASKQTYVEAKKLLEMGLASKPMQKFNVIKQLSLLKLNHGDEPFKYISSMRQIMEAVKSLEMDIDDVLQYFFLNGLNESFKIQLQQVTNNIRPTVGEIVENFFKATELYESVQYNEKPVKESKTTSLVAANVSKGFKNPFSHCTLCDGANHPINKCQSYPKPKNKTERLQSIGACVKCGNSDHDQLKCKFRFKKSCNICAKWHFTFLCPSYDEPSRKPPLEVPTAKKNEGNQKESKKPFTGMAQSIVASLHNSQNIDSILSTLTVYLPKTDAPVRALMDFGSQSSFIAEDLLKNETFNVLDGDVNVEVKGINETRTYKSQLVEVNLKFGDDYLPVKLLSLPTIDICLDLPNLARVVLEFKTKNYKLADSYLDFNSSSIRDFGILLGANASHCFEGEYVKFGSSSTYLKTKFGVLLVGDVNSMCTDLVHLPHNTSKTFSFAANINIGSRSISQNTSKSPVDDDYDLCANGNDTPISKLSEIDLDNSCDSLLSKDVPMGESDVDKEQLEYLLENCYRTCDGRQVIPILWNEKVKHLLSNNFNLAKAMLMSCLKKFSDDKEKLVMIEDNFKDLESQNIIEKVDSEKMMSADVSFLPHMTIFKPHKETSKARTVFLSNLCEKNTGKISHNQAMFSGPCLNQKLTTALTHLRFNPKLLVFDIKKAFLQIELPEEDKDKLLFLWFKNVKEGDFTIQAYRNNRLPFGLRPSPTCLMLCLFKILMLDSSDDSPELQKLKHLIYALIYMDNGAVSGETSDELCSGFETLPDIFGPYKFELQQYATNDENLKNTLDQKDGTVGLFGLKWDTIDDTIAINKVCLNESANTKRKVLMTIASVYDVFNFEGPILNRARLFLHKLQSDKDFGWNKPLNTELMREWKNIAKQYNSAPTTPIPRFVGNRSDSYKLVAYTDASTMMFGCVIYIQCIRTNVKSFVMAKNRIVGKPLEGKTVPSLELAAITLGTETLHDLKDELSGPQCVSPIAIVEMELFSDSLVALNWLKSFSNKLEKMNKVNTFVKNRLDRISKLCESFPVSFSFVDGIQNPADFISRPVSYKILSQSNYRAGPCHDDGESASRPDIMTFIVPNPAHYREVNSETVCMSVTQAELCPSEHIIPLTRFSKLRKLLGTFVKVLKFIENMKTRVKQKKDMFQSFKENETKSTLAMHHLLKTEQRIHFGEVFTYFSEHQKCKKDIPNLVSQLNLFIDNSGLIRVGSKMMRHRNSYFPILLPKTSMLTELLLSDMHQERAHLGIYSLLAELRKQYWLPCCFSVAKRIIRKCVHCKRYNSRPVKLNQGMYRDFRLSPSQKPFSHSFIDYAGPYNVILGKEKRKVYILVITCLFTRAVNLKVSMDLSTEEFIRSFQLHCFDHGIPQKIFSDMGTQLVAGAEVVSKFLSDEDTVGYFKESGSEVVSFDQFFKGHKQLGSLVECCVKLIKRLLSGAIRNHILPLREFEFFVCQTKHLVNRRPIAFKESLRDTTSNDLPEPITPELLLNGFSLISANINPNLQIADDLDPDFGAEFDPVRFVRATDDKLRKVRTRLFRVYNQEFVPQLVTQAVNSKDRYKPVTHKSLKVGDVVLVEEEHTKRTNLPMGRILEVQINNLNEVTGALVLKGATGEKVKRHSSVLIPLLTDSEWEADKSKCRPQIESEVERAAGGKSKDLKDRPASRTQRRKAALQSEKRTRSILE